MASSLASAFAASVAIAGVFRLLAPQRAETSRQFGALVHKATSLRKLGRLEESEACCRTALELAPGSPDAHAGLAAALSEQMRLGDAIACYRRAVATCPDAASIHSDLVATLHYHLGYDPAAIIAEHLKWAARHAAPFRETPRPFPRPSGPRLRIGYVSADFREHPVARLMGPVLRSLDRSAFRTVCYSDVDQADDVTDRLRDAADEWHDVSALDDEALAEKFRADGIDILVDLAGHTASNRLLVFARRPAPVQVSHFGYPDTTGLNAIDYRITDPYADPLGMTERLHMEKLVRLPDCAWCYDPPADAPAVSERPSDDRGPLVFGCLNNLMKVTPQAIALWCRILQAVPASQLLLLTTAGESRYVRRQFKQHGIVPERVELAPRVPRAGYFHLYSRIDIALDPFPYNGGVTSCEALWMGVPLVTLAGRTYVSRQGVMLLSNLGLRELVADSPEQYVRIAAALALDNGRRERLRRSLRGQILSSPLMNVGRYCEELGEAYRRMWQETGAPVAAGTD